MERINSASDLSPQAFLFEGTVLYDVAGYVKLLPKYQQWQRASSAKKKLLSNLKRPFMLTIMDTYFVAATA
ncbi:unnamed protein product [Leptosia nina]|uniref:Uncharacterized protein n=1 Tax=Leptosia nina TaxID=320188 RepID=A0AAV1K210_9NEOP